MSTDSPAAVPQWEVPVWGGDESEPETMVASPSSVPTWGDEEPLADSEDDEAQSGVVAPLDDTTDIESAPSHSEQEDEAETAPASTVEPDVAPESAPVDRSEPSEAPATTPTRTPGATATKRPRRRTASTQNTLSWQDVSNIFDFSERYEELSEEGRSALADLTDLPRGTHPVEIAEALYPAGGDLAAFTFMLEVVGLVNGGDIPFSEGARLVNKVDSLPDAVAKSFARQVAGLTGVDIKHRRNSVTLDFVALVLDSLNKTRQNGGLDTLIEIKNILDIWPGGKK